MSFLRRSVPKNKRWLGVPIAAIGLIAVALLLTGGSDPEVDDAGATGTASSSELPPLPWEGESGTKAAAAPAPEESAGKTGFITAAKHGVENMPPASAGSNGSYKPRPESEREQISALTHPDGGPDSAERAALLLGDTAIAPSGAPLEIQGAISAANQLVGQPYRWGGGHGSWRSRGYDCSGAVSYALAGGGLLGVPLTSGQLMAWGVPGRGRWLTVYANPGHTYAVIAGLRWDTVGNARGEGPRWHPADAYPSGFVARHIPGL